jgi:general secretion pathway protein G
MGRSPRGFTLVELLVVIVILAILIALLLPAINAALRTAKNTGVGSEINQLAQALESFKTKYGDYPPSRVYLAENGDYSVVASNTTLGASDITLGQLAQRTLQAMRKFFPRVTLSTSGPVFAANSNVWYDFNGDGVMGTLMPDGSVNRNPYILQGHQCLVFFLGGIPFQDGTNNYAMAGFSKEPTNPFRNNIPLLPNGHANPMYSNNRQLPLFEFNPARLLFDPNPSPYTSAGLPQPTIPGYVDSYGNPLGNGQINFYAYFSSYGNGGYDPNDVNFPETDVNGSIPLLAFRVGYPIANPAIRGVANTASSEPPNPYTSTTTVPTTNVTTFQKPQSFQIISSGVDGLYGVGGQYSPSGGEALPMDSNAHVYMNSTTDMNIRGSERDNISNFSTGRLE